MRYGLLGVAILFVAGVGALLTPWASGQVKDKKEPPKDKKDKGPPKIDPKDIPSSPDFKTPDEILGKGFEYWKKKIRSDDQSEREIAIKNILFFGAEKSYEAVPDILAELSDHKGNKNVDLSVRVNGIQALSTIFRYKKEPAEKDLHLVYEKHLQQAYTLYKVAMGDTQIILKMQTMKALPYLGSITRDSLGTVVKLGQENASWEIRREAIPVMVALASPEVKGGKPDAKYTAIVMPHLAKYSNPANEKSFLVRQAALQGIATLGEHVPKEIIRALEDPSLPVRLTALQCLAGMSHHWDPKDPTDRRYAESKLLDYLEHEKDVPLNMWTHAVIMTIHKKVGEPHIGSIRNRLAHKDPAVRALSLQIIAMAGPDAKPFVLENVKSTVNDGDFKVGVQACQTLVAIHAVEAVPMLKAMYDDEKLKKANPTLHYAVAEALDAFEVMEKMQKEKKDNEKKPIEKK